MTDADHYIQMILMKSDLDLTLFDTTTEISIVAGIRTYALPADSVMGIIRKVEYSYNGDALNYVRLDPIPRGLVTSQSSYDVTGWDTTGSNSIIVDGTPQNSGGKLRVTYAKQADSLDIRRGMVASLTNDGTNYLTLTLVNDSNLNTANEALFAQNIYICANDYVGNVSRYNLQYSSYDSSSKTFSLAGGQAISAGIILPNQFVTIGTYSTTQSKLPIQFDQYRRKYAINEIQYIKESVSIPEYERFLEKLEEDLLEVLFDRATGPIKIPIINSFWR